MKNNASRDALDRALTDLYKADVPAGYSAAWRDAVQREEKPPMKPTPRFAWLRQAALPMAAAVVLVVGTLVTGTLSPKTTNPAPAYDTDMATATEESYKAYNAAQDLGYVAPAGAAYAPMPAAYTKDAAAETAWGGSAESLSGTTAEAAADERKIVRTVSLTLTTTAFERDYDEVLALAKNADGYASSVSLYDQQSDTRSAAIELKIPADRLDGFLSALEGVGRISSRYETSDDLTTQYADTTLRLKTQQDKMTRLQELLLQAKDVSDLLEIESQIADTQYALDSLQASLLTIDRQVDYSSVSVYLTEQSPIDTAAETDVSVGERIMSGLKATLHWIGGFFENMLVFLVAAAPVLVPLIVLTIVILAVRKRRKHNPQP